MWYFIVYTVVFIVLTLLYAISTKLEANGNIVYYDLDAFFAIALWPLLLAFILIVYFPGKGLFVCFEKLTDYIVLKIKERKTKGEQEK